MPRVRTPTAAPARRAGGPPPAPPLRSGHRPIGLACLRGFEASARLLSFTLAAAELHLTQSSVSRQVQSLEEEVGQPLFVRHTRALSLTPAGERLYRAVLGALQAVDRAVDEVRGVGQPPRLGIATYASFASLWLVPRLAAFQRLYPDLEIRIDAADRLIDLESEGMDVALRWIRPERAPPGALRLADEAVTPAVSPRLLARTGIVLERPEDLQRLQLIEMDEDLPTSRGASWKRWFAHAGVTPRRGAGRIQFTFVDQTVQAAVRGHGAVLGRRLLIDDHLASGELLTPFPQLWMRTGFSYFLVVNPAREREPHVAAFRDWMLAQFGAGTSRAG